MKANVDNIKVQTSILYKMRMAPKGFIFYILTCQRKGSKMTMVECINRSQYSNEQEKEGIEILKKRFINHFKLN